MDTTASKNIISKKNKKLNDLVFTMEDVRNVIKQKEDHKEQVEVNKIVEIKQDMLAAKVNTVPTQQKVQAASLADILGFNPQVLKKNNANDKDPSEVPEKYRKYYKMLLQLKRAIHNKQSHASIIANNKVDPDLEGFDCEFALSLLPNEQEALIEIDQAIQRIYKGTYGICEITGKPIEPQRLQAVPFARYSLEGKEEQEKLHTIKEQDTSSMFDTEQADDINEFSNYEEE